MRAAFGTEVEEKLKPRLTLWEVVKRVAVGSHQSGWMRTPASQAGAACVPSGQFLLADPI